MPDFFVIAKRKGILDERTFMNVHNPHELQKV